MKALKYGLLGVAAVALAAAAVVAYFAATFDPRDYQPRIVELVKEKTGRTLAISGELKLSFWPDLGVRLGAVSLSERGSDERFADAENVRFTVKLAPLLSRELVADELLLEGAHVRITRFADGRLNIDDLIKSQGPTPQFDVGRVKLERSALSFRDLANSRQYELAAIELETGRIAKSVVTPLKLALTVRDAQDTFDVALTLKARLAIDLDQQSYGLSEAAMTYRGRLSTFKEASGSASGSFAARLKTAELSASKVAANVSGSLGENRIDATLDVLKLGATGGEIRAESASMSLRASGGGRVTQIKAASPVVVRTTDSIVADAATLALDSTRDGETIEASLTSPIDAKADAGTLALTQLQARLSARGPRLPRTGISGVLSGKALLDFPKERMQASLAGQIGESKVKAEVTTSGFAAPEHRFIAAIDRLDVDRYTAAGPTRANAGGGFDLSALARLPATGTLEIGRLTMGGVTANQVKLAVKP